MRKIPFIFLGFFIAIFSTTMLFSKTSNQEYIEEQQSRLDALAKFTRIVGTVEKLYVDDMKIQEIVDKAIDGLLTNLDAHSSFMDEKKYKELQVQTKGEFGGLGITVGMRDGALTVIAPIEGTPADKVGLKSEDIILKIDGQATLSMTIDEAVAIMRGKPKTKIELTVVRKGETKPLNFTIIRDIIKIKSVYTKKINNEVLYVRVTSFDKNVVDGLKKALKESKPWAKGIILDLRNNPGGLLNQAIGVVDMFVEDGIIVSQKGRLKSENVEFSATKDGTYKDIPIVTLVNGGSASASEIVSGGLQDHKRSVVVGTKTFGKGSVQVILPIGQKEGLRLTIARYYLPSGRTIQAKGVTPDVVVHAGKVPHKKDEFSVKESDLKKHLEIELEKTKTKEEKQKDKESKDKKESENNDKNVLSEEDLYSDIQLKTGVDILKALMILKK
jgi:carboxyl-terminal processing protease